LKPFNLKQLENGTFAVLNFNTSMFTNDSYVFRGQRKGRNYLFGPQDALNPRILDQLDMLDDGLDPFTGVDMRPHIEASRNWTNGAMDDDIFRAYYRARNIRRAGWVIGILSLLAALACIVIFVIVPLFQNDSSSSNSVVTSDNVLMTVPSKESFSPRTSLSRLVQIVSDTNLENATLIDSFDSISVSFTIDPTAYPDDIQLNGLIYCNDLMTEFDALKFMSYYSIIELGNSDDDPIVSVMQKDMSSSIKLMNIILFTANG
jgi:hypothetical protein